MATDPTKDVMTSINISLPFSMKEFVDQEVTAEGYGTVSEFFRELLREAKRRKEDQQLEKYLLQALNSPVSPITKEDWEEIKRNGLAELRKKQIEELRKDLMLGIEDLRAGRSENFATEEKFLERIQKGGKKKLAEIKNGKGK
jgi:antitoxin ParD1/3/4